MDDRRAAEVVARGSGATVLIVEDDADARQTLEELVGLLGHRVVAAADAAEAFHHARTAPLDVALVDICLPNADGCEVARGLRALAAGTPLRLVALTGFADSATREAASSAGFDDFVVKPVMPDRLQELLRNSARRP